MNVRAGRDIGLDEGAQRACAVAEHDVKRSIPASRAVCSVRRISGWPRTGCRSFDSGDPFLKRSPLPAASTSASRTVSVAAAEICGKTFTLTSSGDRTQERDPIPPRTLHSCSTQLTGRRTPHPSSNQLDAGRTCKGAGNPVYGAATRAGPVSASGTIEGVETVRRGSPPATKVPVGGRMQQCAAGRAELDGVTPAAAKQSKQQGSAIGPSVYSGVRFSCGSASTLAALTPRLTSSKVPIPVQQIIRISARGRASSRVSSPVRGRR